MPSVSLYVVEFTLSGGFDTHYPPQFFSLQSITYNTRAAWVSFLLAPLGVFCRCIENWLGQTGQVRQRGTLLSEQIENHNFILSSAQPRPRNIESQLRAYVPEAPDGVTIDPQSSLSQIVDVEKNIPDLFHLEGAAEKARAGCGAGFGGI